MTSETATMRLPPGPRHACRGLREASGLRRPTATLHTPSQRTPWAGLRKVLGCKLPGLAALRPPCPY